MLWGIGIVLVVSVGLVALRTMVQHQVLAINLPLRLRWDFHRLMLRQSLSFFSDEFAGRVTTKVMQTALAVREVLFTFIEIVLAIGVYFITIIALAGGFDLRLMLPFIAWWCCSGWPCATSCRVLARSGRSRPMRARP